MTYAIGSFVITGNNFADLIIEFILDLMGLAMVIFAFPWLKKKILLIGLFTYLIAYNFRLLINPLFTSDDYSSYDYLAFLLKLDIIAFIILIVGLFDDKYFNSYSKISPYMIIAITIIGTIAFQFLVRNFG